MKIKIPKDQEFTGKVEVAINAIDEKGVRLSPRSSALTVHRKSLRVEETTVSEVYEVILKALAEHCKKGGELDGNQKR